MYRRTKDEYHLPKGVSNRNKGLVIIKQAPFDTDIFRSLSSLSCTERKGEF